jgi:phosphatidylglycerol:prolipoprotein diacylglycerol transferase
LIGGHLLYGITNIDKFWLFAKVKNFNGFITLISLIFGGQVFYGGLFGGIAAAVIFAGITRLENFSAYTDIMAAGVPLFHFFGRIGCFLGGCCYGIECDFGFTTHNSLIASANGVNRFPVQLFEAGFCLLLALFMIRLMKKERFAGKLFYIYLFTYAVGRFILEFFRGDSYRGFLFGLSTSQIISLIVIVTILCCLFARKSKNSV